MRVLVCGGRDLLDEVLVHQELDQLAHMNGWLTIIEGGNKSGADKFARRWARQNYHGLVTVEANWHDHGRAAGPIRNQEMLDKAKPDCGLAFPSPVRGLFGTGTGDMVQRLRDAHVPVRVVEKSTEKKGLFT